MKLSDLKLVENWRQWYRMLSVQMLLVIGGVQGILAVLSPQQTMRIVPFAATMTWADLGTALTVIAAAIGFIGRFVDQNLGSSAK